MKKKTMPAPGKMLSDIVRARLGELGILETHIRTAPRDESIDIRIELRVEKDRATQRLAALWKSEDVQDRGAKSVTLGGAA